jgi:hypothetical protein
VQVYCKLCLNTGKIKDVAYLISLMAETFYKPHFIKRKSYIYEVFIFDYPFIIYWIIMRRKIFIRVKQDA